MLKEKTIVLYEKGKETHKEYTINQGDYFSLKCVEKGDPHIFIGFNFKLGDKDENVEFEQPFVQLEDGSFVSYFESIDTNKWNIGKHRYEIEGLLENGNKISVEKYLFNVEPQIGKE